MGEDPLVAEVRRGREAYAARYDYNLHSIYCALKAQEQTEACEKVSFPPKVVPPPVQISPALPQVAAAG